MAEPSRADRLSDEQLARFISIAAEHGTEAFEGQAPPDADTVVAGGPETVAPAAGETWGKFVIEKALGRGGQAIVCQAFDRLGPAGHVALKIPRRAVPPSRVESWIQEEAGPLGKLDHPNIVRVVDAGAVDGVPFVATRLIEGLPLSSHALRARPSERQVLDWMIQLADALDYAHRSGVVHRDLKPANVVIAADGRPLIIDFGLSSLISAYQPTHASDTSGTPAFMAPEQARPGAEIDHRVDIFALGGVLKCLLDGAGPYGAGQVSRQV
ncbi:MAG: serine/threonine-protein kinase, partial [Phycisphaerae bacterium]